MSESRQRFTGRAFLLLLGLIFLWLLFVTLPLFTRYLQVGTMDPRLMTPADLTWQRMLFNFLSKPGIRGIFVVVIGACGLFVGMVSRVGKKPKRKLYAKSLRTKAPFSMEWVIDGTRKNNLIEYGSFVGVINNL